MTNTFAVFIISFFFISACAKKIPDTPIELSKAQTTKLQSLAPISLTKVPYFTTTCFTHEPGIFSYYVTSGGTAIKEHEAKWVCSHHTECPVMKLEAVDGSVYATDIEASISDFSKATVHRCAEMMIDSATDHLLVTPQFMDSATTRKNTESWATES